ncbi:MAG: hypothetical protein ACE5I2_03435 [Anaerolineae bacterium]
MFSVGDKVVHHVHGAGIIITKYEYYNSETGEPPTAAADAYGWTAAVFIDLAIQASRDEGIEQIYKDGE